jgi:predicted nucleotidyltransferase
MLSETNKQVIVDTAQKYNVSAVYLFGSSLVDETTARDIDLGVLGVPPGLFFDFYGELMKRLPKPVDLIDLSKATLFNKLVLRDGMKIYG